MNVNCIDCGIVLFMARKDKRRCSGCNKKHRTALALERERAKGRPPRGVAKKDITCLCCSLEFKSERRTRHWCDKCRSLGKEARASMVLERKCQWCGKSWTVKRGERCETIKRYCSDECRREGARESRYNSKARERNGEPRLETGRKRTRPIEVAKALDRGSLQDRFFHRYPERERKCESCGEARVVDLAHKIPRRSAWRILPKSEEVWVLCPTCHRCLDGGIQTVSELDLPP